MGRIKVGADRMIRRDNSRGTVMTGEKGVEAYVRALASEHGVSEQEDYYDRLARVLTKLSDDDVELDEVERLLVALKRKGVIEKTEMLMLQLEYLSGKRG